MSRLFAAVCLIAVALLATASTRIAPTSHAGSAPESRVDGAMLCQGPACARPQRSPELSLRGAELGAKPLARTPGPIAGRGYRLVFKDTFRRLRRRVWDNREWWNTPPPRRSQYVRNGILHLVSRRSQGYPSHIAVTTFSSQKIFRYGYFEARMKWTKGNGSWPGFWMISNAWARGGADDCSTAAAEIDVFEGYGNHPRVFTGAIHRNSGDWLCPPEDEINQNSWQPQRVDLTRRFHTYAMRWTPARVTWFLDQRRIMSWPVFETTNTRMFLILSMYTGGESQPDSSSPAALHTKVNWVRVWQKR